MPPLDLALKSWAQPAGVSFALQYHGPNADAASPPFHRIDVSVCKRWARVFFHCVYPSCHHRVCSDAGHDADHLHQSPHDHAI